MKKFYRIDYNGSPRHAVEDAGTWRLLDGDLFGSHRPGAEIAPSGHRLLPPVAPSKMVCIGLNYKDHAAEQNKPLPATAASPFGAAGGNVSAGVTQIGSDGSPSTICVPTVATVRTMKHCCFPATASPCVKVVASSGFGLSGTGAVTGAAAAPEPAAGAPCRYTL